LRKALLFVFHPRLAQEEIMSVGEIAKRVGYKHQGHFSKLFFKTYGVYPKNLLKTL